MNILGVIPARGGSKGLPGKNIRPLGGLPLIAWSVRSAKESKLLTRTIVSTDDAEIAEAAREHGGDVPFVRPKELAKDDTSCVDVAQHAVRWLESKGQKPDLIVWLQPTSPFRTARHIDETIKLVLENPCDSAQTVALDPLHPWHRFKLEGSKLIHIHPEVQQSFMMRQKAIPLYRPNGGVFVSRYDLLMKQGRITGDNNLGFIQEQETSIDIDTAWDFRLAEFLLQERVVTP